MRFFKKRERNYRWKPLYCSVEVILRSLDDCIEIGAPLSNLVINYQEKTYKIGLISDYNRKVGFFDTCYYLDDQLYETKELFLNQAHLGSLKFKDITEKIAILEDREIGDPRHNQFFLEEGSDSPE